MHAWATFWAGVILVALTLFTVLALVVTIGGWRDLRTMLGRDSRESRDKRK